ncbi:MAG TPA: MFS transporter [Saprospiraceae bacterium]|nr:MFS transporter [Saprospiraceae bacterium]
MLATEVLGLKQNWRQFVLLVGINALVGGMVGIERTIFPEYAHSQFGIVSNTALLSFIAAFGLSKALSNYFSGKWTNVLGRKNMLVLGWVIAIPVPLILLYTHQWHWVVFANVLLGMSQGFTWSSTIVMKIDLAGEKDRGLAMGLNEFSGYLAVGLVAWLTGYLAHHFGVVPYPFYVGLAIAVSGLLASVFLIKDTIHHVRLEREASVLRPLRHVFRDTTYKHKNLSAITQAGLINNLNDGMIWGLLPVWLFNQHYSPPQIALVVSIYPVVWGLGQFVTGKMGDVYSRKKMMVAGMTIQGLAILGMINFATIPALLAMAVTLGLGTALVYPTFLSTIASIVSPSQRAESLGVFRLWRDLGYVFGALFSGIIADLFDVSVAIAAVGILTLISAIIIQMRMVDKNLKCIQQDEKKRFGDIQKKVTIIDVRSKSEYETSHIPGAINIPIEDFSYENLENFKNNFVITACGKGGGRSETAALILQKMGISARWLCGGTFGWSYN